MLCSLGEDPPEDPLSHRCEGRELQCCECSFGLSLIVLPVGSADVEECPLATGVRGQGGVPESNRDGQMIGVEGAMRGPGCIHGEVSANEGEVWR